MEPEALACCIRRRYPASVLLRACTHRVTVALFTVPTLIACGDSVADGSGISGGAGISGIAGSLGSSGLGGASAGAPASGGRSEGGGAASGGTSSDGGGHPSGGTPNDGGWHASGGSASGAGAAGAAPAPPCTISEPTLCPESMPTYSTVAPIFESRCVTCHSGVGGHWPLDTYGHVVTWRDTIQAALLTCEMPPPESGQVVSESESRLILTWIFCGMPR